MRDANTLVEATMSDEEEDALLLHPAVEAMRDADSADEAFSGAVVQTAALIYDANEDFIGEQRDDLGSNALLVLPAPVLSMMLAYALTELAEMTIAAEKQLPEESEIPPGAPGEDSPANATVEAPSSEPVSSVLPLGAYVRVDTTKPTADGGMEPETYIGIIRGYDLGRTKYNVGARFQTWGEWKFGDGGWWCFLSEATEITYEEAHTK